MSNTALSNNATSLAISPNAEENWDYKSSALRASDKILTKTSLTRERAGLNRQSLISVCKEDFRTHFAAVYGKTDRLPTVVFERIEQAVDNQIKARLAEVTPMNAVSYRRGFAFKANDMSFVDRITLVGENTLALEEQRLACDLAIGIAERRLADVEKKVTPDYDREKEIRAYLMKLATAKNFIEGEISHQKDLVKPTAT